MRQRLITFALALLLTSPVTSAELDQYGNAHQWMGTKGRYTVIDFAAAWCGPCWKTLPKLQALAHAHPSVDFLVVSVDDEVDGRDRLVERVPLTLPVLWDEDYRIAEHYRPAAMPATYVLDPHGEVIHQHVGSARRDWETFEKLITDLPSSVATSADED